MSVAVGTVPLLQLLACDQLPPAELIHAFTLAATVMANAALVPEVSPEALATSVYPAPTLSIEMPLNVATPATALWVSVPDSAPPAGLVPIATVTGPVKPVATLPTASFAVTAKPNGASESELAGGWVAKASEAAAPAPMVSAVLVALVTPVAAAVSV